MASLRQFLLAALPATSLLVACGGGDGEDLPDPATGPHYGYVADSVTVPASTSQARDIGLDLNGDKTIDNQLGMVLGTLAGQGFKVKDTLDLAVASGDIILLLDLQTPDFASTTGAAMSIKLGDAPSVAPCTDPANPTIATCGHHLTGGTTFQISANSPNDAGVDGKIAGGVFQVPIAAAGAITLQIALADNPISLNLIGARAKATGMSADGIDEVILAGAISQQELDTQVIPTIQAQLPPLIERDCTDLANPQGCGCASGSTGKTIIGLFDTNPKDCMVTVEEIKTNSLIQSLLAPDVTIKDQNGTPVDALSIGISLSAKSAHFPGIDGN